METLPLWADAAIVPILIPDAAVLSNMVRVLLVLPAVLITIACRVPGPNFTTVVARVLRFRNWGAGGTPPMRRMDCAHTSRPALTVPEAEFRQTEDAARAMLPVKGEVVGLALCSMTPSTKKRA